MSSSSSMISNNAVIVGSCLSLTLQLTRLSMDYIQAASRAPDSDSSGKTIRSEKTNKTGYGSVSSNQEDTSPIIEQQPPCCDDDEAKPLLVLPFEEETSRHKSIRIHLFILAWALEGILFSCAFAFHWTPRYPNQLLAITAIVSLVEILLLTRDANKEHYGTVQRFFQHVVYFILWFLYFKQSRTTAWDCVIFGAVTVLLLLSILDGLITNRLPHIQRKCACQKRYMSRRALFVLLKPYFWPNATSDSAVKNRIRAIATWVCVIGSKVCGLYSPLFLGWASTSLAHSDYRQTIIYSIAYCAISFLGSAMKEGQSLVYLKVAQAAFIQLSEAAFEHLHSLSLDFHIRKKLGETLRSMDRGIAACDTLMKYMFLWLVPAFVECVVVCVIFAAYFQYLPLALAVFYFVFFYVVGTILVTLWRKQFRKALVQSDNRYHDLFTDSMVNFETVKYFTAEDFEKRRFGEAIKHYQAGSVSVQASLSFLNISQQILLKCCLATALTLSVLGIRKRSTCCTEIIGCDSMISDCCANVSHDECPGMKVGDFVAVLTYTLNLFTPLNFLGSVYNSVVMAIVDLGNMSELLAENPDVTDAPDAMDLPLKNSKDDDIAVEFDNVLFHYPSQPTNQGLKGLSFVMKRGTTTAIVGPTGAGKTTVSRLLFRFYDVLGGAIKINGVDVRSVTQRSLRNAIGVVPQAASMFNDTIRYNLLYGRREATQEELEQAALDAQILKFIESLDDGWESLVGDRGLKLSGGEKQRAAIARCLLKDPPFVLLDEATSALDTITEKSVQEALDRLGKSRTVLVIAHRLGTIRNADNIIVLKDGVVAEQGTHDELMRMKGIYAEMWNMQLHSTR